MALERSFSSQPEIEIANEESKFSHREPMFTDKPKDVDDDATDIVPESQRALDDLKKGWLEVEKKQENSEDTLAYPFGGWTDADKYQK